MRPRSHLSEVESVPTPRAVEASGGASSSGAGGGGGGVTFLLWLKQNMLCYPEEMESCPEC